MISKLDPKTILLGLALSAAFATGLACGSLSDALLEEECLSSSDCAGGLGCFQPIPISSVGGPTPVNSIGLGWCLEQPACVVGAQPFCPCAADVNGQPTCEPSQGNHRLAVAPVVCRSPTEAADCWCVPQGGCVDPLVTGAPTP